MAGFFSGEGCFSVGISKVTDCKTGYSVKLQIFMGEHSKYKL
jgi:LAGLIDADG endonuclease